MSTYTCPRCQAPIQAGQQHCANCGLALDPTSVAAYLAQAGPAPTAPPPGYPAGGGAVPPAYPPSGYTAPPNAGTVDPIYRPDYTAPPNYTAAPVIAASARPKWLVWGLGCLGALILGCVVIGGFAFFAATGLTQPVVDAGESFMNARKGDDYARAYDLCTPSLQQTLGSAEGLASLTANRRPSQWSWSSRDISNGTGTLTGQATYKNGVQGDAQLVLAQVGSSWKVDGIHLK